MEHRKFERFGSDMIFWIRKKDAEGDYEPFEIENISAGGILCRSQARFQKDETVQLNFELPQHTDLINAEAVVRHCQLEEADQLYRTGVEFTTVSGIENEALMVYLEELFKGRDL